MISLWKMDPETPILLELGVDGVCGRKPVAEPFTITFDFYNPKSTLECLAFVKLSQVFLCQ